MRPPYGDPQARTQVPTVAVAPRYVSEVRAQLICKLTPEQLGQLYDTRLALLADTKDERAFGTRHRTRPDRCRAQRGTPLALSVQHE